MKRWGCPIVVCQHCGCKFIEHDIVEPGFILYPFAWLPRIRLGNAAAFISGIMLLSEGFMTMVNPADLALYWTSAVLLLYYPLRNTLCDRVHGERSFKRLYISIVESRDRLKYREYIELLNKSGYRIPYRLLR